ncbi:porin [Odoribacter sp. Z80]|uniref:porin n=1 Tax=Odoribacter sp. Z80 TaxID=2304575 RepID=UPI001379417E|nr:porin [Odoribacter sp. Z80]NCE71914.1 porin [Odoribacter sp. Z80]
MRKLICAILFASYGFLASAQEIKEELLTLRLEARLDYLRNRQDGKTIKDNTGFEGKFINIRADGKITDKLSYSWRQRFNKQHEDGSFFDATDWIYIHYNIGKWAIAGGKQVVNIGGWEYDRAPIDLYECSVFWNNIPCYAIGASAGYRLSSSDLLTAQVCQSPFFTSENRNMYAYNLMWQGSHKWFHTLYSVNLIETTPGHYINYIALGNKFIYKKFALELDLMNRASAHQTFLFKDASVMGELSYAPCSKWNIYGKMTYDVNHTNNTTDFCVLPGTELTMAGGGFEFYPLAKKNHALRIHANVFYSWGKNANPGNTMQDKSLIFDIGIKWNMNLLAIKHK